MNLGASLLVLLAIVTVSAGRTIPENKDDGKDVTKNSAIDLGFLVENPGNEESEGEEWNGGKDAFLQSRDFIRELAKHFNVSIAGVHIGVVTYGSEPYMAFDFNEHLSNHQVQDALSGLTRPSRGSRVSKALKFVMSQLFKGSARPDAYKILIILASKGGRGEAPEIADKLKKSGVTIYSIAVDSKKEGGMLLNDMVSEPLEKHKFKSESQNLKSLVPKIKNLILKKHKKASFLERLENANLEDIKHGGPHNDGMKWVTDNDSTHNKIKAKPTNHVATDTSNHTQAQEDLPLNITKGTFQSDEKVLEDDGMVFNETQDDLSNSLVVSKNLTSDTENLKNTPNVPEDTIQASEYSEEIPKVNTPSDDVSNINENSEPLSSDPANSQNTPNHADLRDSEHIHDIPKDAKEEHKDAKATKDAPQSTKVTHNVFQATERAKSKAAPDDAISNVNVHENSPLPSRDPGNSKNTQDHIDPHDSDEIHDITKGAKQEPKDTEVPKDATQNTRVSKHASYVADRLKDTKSIGEAQNAPKEPEVRKDSQNNAPKTKEMKPSDEPKKTAGESKESSKSSEPLQREVSKDDELPRVISDYPFESNFTQDEIPETRTIKSPAPSGQITNPKMSTKELPKMGKLDEPERLPTPKDADPSKAEPAMAEGELPSMRSGEKLDTTKEIGTVNPDKESSTDAPPDAPAPSINTPKTKSPAAPIQRPKEPTPDDSKAEIQDPEIPEAVNSSPATQISQKSANKHTSKVKADTNTFQTTDSSSSEVKPKEESPEMPMSEEEQPSDIPPPDSPPPVKAKKVGSKKAALEKKSDTPSKQSNESSENGFAATPDEASPDSTVTSTEGADTPQTIAADKTTENPDTESSNEQSPVGSSPEETKTDNPDEKTPKKISIKKVKSRPKISKHKKKKRHGLVKLLKGVHILSPKMPPPALVRAKEAYESPAKRVSLPRAGNSSVEEGGDEIMSGKSNLSYELQKRLFGVDNDKENRKPKDKNNNDDESNEDESKEHTQPATEVIGKQCKARVDVAFLLDGSKQVSKDHFQESVKFVKKIIKSFEVSRDQAHVAMVVCSERPHILFDLKAFNDHNGIYKAMDSISYPNGKLFAGGCLKTIRTGVFQNSGRHDVPKILYFITGGKSRDSVDLPSRALRDMGVQVFSLGIGSKYSGVELKTLSTAPYSDHVMATKYRVLNLLRPYVSAQLCRGSGGKFVKPSMNVKKHIHKPTPTKKRVFDETDLESKAEDPKLDDEKTSTSDSSDKKKQKDVKAKRRAILKASIKKKLHILLSNLGSKYHSENAVYRSIIENINGHQDANCKDYHVLCKSWGKGGLCKKNSKYGIDAISVQRVCPKTCSVCYP